MARIKFLQEDFAGFRPDRVAKPVDTQNKNSILEVLSAVRQGVQATKEVVGAGLATADFLTQAGVIGPKSREQLVEEAAKKRAEEVSKQRETQRTGMVSTQQSAEEQRAKAIEAEMGAGVGTTKIDPMIERRKGREELTASIEKFKKAELNPAEFAGELDKAVKGGFITPDEAQKLGDVVSQQAETRAERERALLTRTPVDTSAQTAAIETEKKRLDDLIVLHEIGIKDKYQRLKKMDFELSGSPDDTLAQQRLAFIDDLRKFEAENNRLKQERKKLDVAPTTPEAPTELERMAGTRPLEEQLRVEQRYDLLKAPEGKESIVPPVVKEKIDEELKIISDEQAKTAFEQLDKIAPTDRTNYQQYLHQNLGKRLNVLATGQEDELANIKQRFAEYTAAGEERKKAIRDSAQLSDKQKRDAIADIDKKLADAAAKVKAEEDAKQTAGTATQALSNAQLKLQVAIEDKDEADFQAEKAAKDPTSNPAVRIATANAATAANQKVADAQKEVDAQMAKLKGATAVLTAAEAERQAKEEKAQAGQPFSRAVDALDSLRPKKQVAGEPSLEEKKKVLETELAKSAGLVKQLEENEDSRNKAINEASAGLITAAAELQQLNAQKERAGGKITKEQAERMVQLKQYLTQNQDLVNKLKTLKTDDPAMKEMVVELNKIAQGGKGPPPETAEQAQVRFDNSLKMFDAETAQAIKQATEQAKTEAKLINVDADQLKMLAVDAVVRGDRTQAALVLATMMDGKVVGMKPQSLTDWLSGNYKQRYNNEMFDILFHLQKGKSPEELALLQQQLNLKTYKEIGAMEERFSRMDERAQKQAIREEQRAADLRKKEAGADKAEADAKKAMFAARDDVLRVEANIKRLKEEKGFIDVGMLDELTRARTNQSQAIANYNNGRLGLEREKIRSANATEAKSSLQGVMRDTQKQVDDDRDQQEKDLKAVSFYSGYINPNGATNDKFAKDFPAKGTPEYKDAVKKSGLSPEDFEKRRSAITDYQNKYTAGQTESRNNREKTLSATGFIQKGIRDLQIQLAQLDRSSPQFQARADEIAVKSIRLNKLLSIVKGKRGVFTPKDKTGGAPTEQLNDDQVKDIGKRVDKIVGATSIATIPPEDEE